MMHGPFHMLSSRPSLALLPDVVGKSENRHQLRKSGGRLRIKLTTTSRIMGYHHLEPSRNTRQPNSVTLVKPDAATAVPVMRLTETTAQTYSVRIMDHKPVLVWNQTDKLRQQMTP
jgi:hypothetical protein